MGGEYPGTGSVPIKLSSCLLRRMPLKRRSALLFSTEKKIGYHAALFSAVVVKDEGLCQ